MRTSLGSIRICERPQSYPWADSIETDEMIQVDVLGRGEIVHVSLSFAIWVTRLGSPFLVPYTADSSSRS